MGLQYDNCKKSKAEPTGNQWTSYSDLFLSCSFIFLMMYMVANLKMGASGLQQNIEYQRLSKEAEDLKQQIKVYDTLKEEYLQKQASKDEKELYEELMSKLDLLQEQAKDEKDKLRLQALENEKKEKALNKYQQLIRNIVNANMMSQSRIKKRDDIITAKREEIDDLQKTVQEKKRAIQVGERKIAQVESELQDKMAKLSKAYQNQQISKKKYETQIGQLKQMTQTEIAKLENQNARVNKELEEANDQLSDVTQELSQAKQQVARKEAEKNQLATELKDTADKYTNEIRQAQADHERRMAQEKARFEDALNKQKLSAEQRAAREAEFRDLAAKKEGELQGKLSGLNMKLLDVNNELSQTRGNLAKQEEEAGKLRKRLEGAIGDYNSQIQKLQDDHAKELARERGAFDSLLNKQAQQKAMSDKERGEREAMFNDLMAKKDRQLNDKVAALKSKIQANEEELRKAQAAANARKNLADRIKSNFARAGVNAEVNPVSGDVVLTFGESYFDTNKAELKPDMKQTLEKFVPIYARSLFEDPKVAEKITSVEIIGFASPTYLGKFVDPKSLDAKDRAAVNFNLDLSFNRAKSIFNYIFDPGTISYNHQQKLRSMAKVSGRSFLAEEKQLRNIASGMDHKEFCAKFDCKKAQRVIIKFDIEH